MYRMRVSFDEDRVLRMVGREPLASLAPSVTAQGESLEVRKLSMSGGFRYTFPVIARGEVRTYDWERGSVAARYCLRRTYAVLTVSTGALWVPRSQPMHLVDGESPPRVPVEAGAGVCKARLLGGANSAATHRPDISHSLYSG